MADDKPKDAFRDVMAAARAEAGRAELAHQSVGRPILETEAALAQAMMEIYASGVTDLGVVAKELTARGIVAPASGITKWDEALLEEELRRANESFDAAYAENGIGA